MEQEKKGGGGGNEGSAVVMVDQSETHVKPYRPTEIQQESDIHHKRSRAPVVPSVAEELKNLAEDAIANQNVNPRDIKDNEGAMSSDHKQKVFKTSSKRRDTSPDIPLQPLGADSKKDATSKVLQQKSIPLPTQPIPPQLQEEKSETSVSKDDAQRNTEEDSITDEVRELQSPGETKRHSEWPIPVTKKHGVSWNDKEYQRMVVLQDLGTKSQDWMLERKVSVGPCFRPGLPFEGPSGITICVPKRSSRCIHNTSGININVSRKSLTNKSKSQNVNIQGSSEKRYKLTTPDNKMNCDIAYAKIFASLKGKVENMRDKLRCVFNV